MDSNKKRKFLIVSSIYSTVVLLCPVLFLLTRDLVKFERPDFVFLIMIFLATVGYFQFLQLTIKRIENPPVTGLAGIALMGFLTVAIFGLLTLQVSQLRPIILAACSVTFLIVTIWTGKKLWMKDQEK